MMQAQHNARTTPGLADFSAALMRANRAGSQAENDISTASVAENTASRAYNSSANRNISSLISQIRDDGPAGSSNARTTPAADHAAKPNRNASENNADMLDDDVVEISSIQKRAPGESSDLLELELKMAQSARQTRSNTWLHFVLIMLITVTAMMAYIVFKLVTETDELRAAVAVQQNYAPAVLAPLQLDTASGAKIEQLLGSVQALSSELVAVNTQQQQLQDLVTAIIPDDFEQQLSELSGFGSTVLGLQTDLTTIQQTLQTLKTDIKHSNRQKPASPKKIVQLKQPSSVIASTDNWIVNLASLSTQQQAQLAVDNLQKAGISPLIQETVVRGKRVYRLSVDGFASRDAAQVFIARAKNSLGFEGGWARLE